MHKQSNTPMYLIAIIGAIIAIIVIVVFNMKKKHTTTPTPTTASHVSSQPMMVESYHTSQPAQPSQPTRHSSEPAMYEPIMKAPAKKSVHAASNGGYSTMSNMNENATSIQRGVGAAVPAPAPSAGDRFLTFVDATSGDQTVKVSNSLKYNPTANYLSVDVSGAYNIKGGSANTPQLLYQAGVDNTQLLARGETGQYLSVDSTGKPIWNNIQFPAGVKPSGTGNEIQYRGSDGSFAAATGFTFGNNKLTAAAGSSFDGAHTGTFAGAHTGTFAGPLTGNVTGNVTGNLLGASGSGQIVYNDGTTTKFLPVGSQGQVLTVGAGNTISYQAVPSAKAAGSGSEIQYRGADGLFAAFDPTKFKVDSATGNITSGGNLTSNNVSTGQLSVGQITATGNVITNGFANSGNLNNTGSLTNIGTLTNTGNITSSGTIQSTGGFQGNVTGNVTGNLTGLADRAGKIVVSAI